MPTSIIKQSYKIADQD